VQTSLKQQNSRITGKNTGKTENLGSKMTTASLAKRSIHAGFKRNSVSKLTGNDFGVTGKLWANNRENVSVHFLHDCRCDSSADIARPDGPHRTGDREVMRTFWRAHMDCWKRSGLNQRQYCEVSWTVAEELRHLCVQKYRRHAR
jgi:hypothetical protein